MRYELRTDPVTLYRLEHGLFRTGPHNSPGRLAERLWGKMGERADPWDGYRPSLSAWDSVIARAGIDPYSARFAFRTLAAAREWFAPSQWRVLRECGYRLRVIQAEMWYGDDVQAAYIPEFARIVARAPIFAPVRVRGAA